MFLRDLRGKRILVFFLLPFYFFLAQRADSSIIKHSGFDSFEAAMALFVIHCFMTRGLGRYTKAIYKYLDARELNMQDSWKKYQDEAAAFFRSLGFEVRNEDVIEGVRGKHKIDVFVVGEVHSISFSWVVECKCWKNNIPKEKVMALISIVQDVGAYRGFLLSEVGFQSGAIRAAYKSNVALTSIDDLKNEAKESLLEVTAANLHVRLSRLKNKIFKLHDNLRPLGQLGILEIALGEALEGQFPTVYFIDESNKRFAANDWEELVIAATTLLDKIEEYVQKH